MYFDVEVTCVIHIGVIADSITEAQHLAEKVVDDLVTSSAAMQWRKT